MSYKQRPPGSCLSLRCRCMCLGWFCCASPRSPIPAPRRPPPAPLALARTRESRPLATASADAARLRLVLEANGCIAPLCCAATPGVLPRLPSPERARKRALSCVPSSLVLLPSERARERALSLSWVSSSSVVLLSPWSARSLVCCLRWRVAFGCALVTSSSCVVVTALASSMSIVFCGPSAYGWIGQQFSSGFSDLAPLILLYNWF